MCYLHEYSTDLPKSIRPLQFALKLPLVLINEPRCRLATATDCAKRYHSLQPFRWVHRLMGGCDVRARMESYSLFNCEVIPILLHSDFRDLPNPVNLVRYQIMSHHERKLYTTWYYVLYQNCIIIMAGADPGISDWEGPSLHVLPPLLFKRGSGILPPEYFWNSTLL